MKTNLTFALLALAGVVVIYLALTGHLNTYSTQSEPQKQVSSTFTGKAWQPVVTNPATSTPILLTVPIQKCLTFGKDRVCQ